MPAPKDPPNPPDKIFISLKRAALMIDMTPRYLNIRINRGDGPPIKRFGRSIRVHYSKFVKWAEKPEDEQCTR